MKNVLKSLAKNFFNKVRINRICIRNRCGSGMTTLIISNEEMNDILKIVKSFKESGLLIKGVRETIKNEAKEQKGRFISMLLGTLGASLLGNLLTGKCTITAGEGTIRAG